MLKEYGNYIQDPLNNKKYCVLWIEGTVCVNVVRTHFRRKKKEHEFSHSFFIEHLHVLSPFLVNRTHSDSCPHGAIS